jgi:MoxR-like ATPase
MMPYPPELPAGTIELGNKTQPLPHELTTETVLAVRAAYAAGRPLLVRGEPGVGKTQLAAAVAKVWGWQLIHKTLDSHTESHDLLYTFDDIARLGEAQLLAHNPDADAANILQPARYLSPGPLWWALDWMSAAQTRQACAFTTTGPAHSDTPPAGVVVVLDEIDKAESDVPNGLLETLGQGSFQVPYRRERICQTGVAPLVIITTNEERELPPAFVRRCWVLALALPDKETNFVAQLSRRGRAHFAKTIHDDALYADAATRLWHSRADAHNKGLPLPGQAEYLDLLRALSTLAQDAKTQRALFNQTKQYVLDKHQTGAIMGNHPQSH